MGPGVFFLVGAKGGVGATTISIELAKQISARGHTLFVDADLSGRRSGAVIFNAIAQLDEKRAEDDYAVIDVTQQLSFFEMTPNIHGGFTLKADKVEGWYSRSIQHIEKFVVLDAPQPFAAAVRPFAVRAACFALIIEPTLLGVTGARAMQLELMRFGVPQSRLVAILCQRDTKPEISKSDIEKHLQLKVAVEVPPRADKRFDRSMVSIVETFIAMPSAELLTLQPSANSPLGERRLGRNAAPPPGQTAEAPHEKRTAVTVRLPRNAGDDLKAEIHRELSKKVDFVAIAGGNPDQLRLEELRLTIEDAVHELVAGRDDIGSAEEIARIRQEVIDEALGLGPLEDLMNDGDVSEIMVNGPDCIYVERSGKLTRSNKRFNDSRALRLVIERIIAPLGRHIDEAMPMVDARLPDGSRVN
ncbi:MAG: ATPase, T2SS/T4P/T4SS family, partial [Candidatus Baltobacteraceae bacterium]